MIDIAIDDGAVQQALAALTRRLGDLSPAMRAIAIELEARAAERFETRRDPAGRPWAPLAAATLERKAGRGSILIDDGDLIDSLTSRADAQRARVGFGRHYAAFHEWGTRHMPRRALLMDDPDAGTLGADDRQAVLELLAEYLDGRL